MASTLDKRIELDNILRDVCPNVYFCPPTGKQLEYPEMALRTRLASSVLAFSLMALAYQYTPTFIPAAFAFL